MKKFLIIFSTSILLVVITILIIINSKTESIIFTSFPKTYSLVCPYHEKEELEVEIYINKTNSFLSDKKAILSSSIRDLNKENILLMQIKNIERVGSEIKYQDEIYYAYKFCFEIDFSVESDFSFLIPEAYLSLSFIHDEIMINIGSFSFYKVPYFGSDDIYVSRLQGVVNEVEEVKTLVGIAIAFKSKSNCNIKITNLRPLDLNLHTSLVESYLLDERKIESSQNIEEIISSYDPFLIERAEGEIELRSKEELRFLIPLKYEELLVVKRLGFLIEYEISGVKYEFYYNEFTFFTDHEYSKSEVNSLIFQTYENY